jgi:hypothetical protein
MSEFDNGDTFPTGDGFNIAELSGLDGTYDNVRLHIYCNESCHVSSVRPCLLFVC